MTQSPAAADAYAWKIIFKINDSTFFNNSTSRELVRSVPQL